MPLTTPQILKLSRKKILEETSELVDDETLLIYGNLTQDDLGKRTFPESAVLSVQIPFTAGVGVLPADFGTLYGDALNGPYDVYPELSIADFSRASGNAVTVKGGAIYMYPAVNRTLTVSYYPTFEAIAVDQDPTIDAYFHELIIYGILYRAYEDLQDEELSKYYRQKYEDELKLKLSALSNYEESNQRGGQLFNGIPIISESGGFSSSPNLF